MFVMAKNKNFWAFLSQISSLTAVKLKFLNSSTILIQECECENFCDFPFSNNCRSSVVQSGGCITIKIWKLNILTSKQLKETNSLESLENK